MARISFVIPAFNEEKYIGKAIDSINQCVVFGEHEICDILVMDNGSTDKTVELAQAMGARVISKLDGTIGALRNYGVSKTSGDILVFLDADVSLTSYWGQHIDSAFTRLESGEKLLTGSHCSPPLNSGNWLHKYWFKSFLEENESTHLGSAHLIVTRQGFAEIGGFSDCLETGEDYDFCQKAKKIGYSIENDHDLLVEHNDFPENLKTFILREIWHGTGDYSSFKSFFSSKVAMLSLVFLSLHIALLAVLYLGSELSALCLLVLIFLIVILSSYVKYAHSSLLSKIINTGIFYFYFWGRAMSLLIVLSRSLRLGRER